jgi:potassium-transporting ATPase KdpC subunit
LRQRIEERVKLLQDADPDNKNLVPVDLVTASASGLDPHISIAAAMYQVPRVARLRGIPREKVAEIVRENTQVRLLGIIGEPVVNVLQLNMALDEYKR